jgi:hypothetical protein
MLLACDSAVLSVTNSSCDLIFSSRGAHPAGALLSRGWGGHAGYLQYSLPHRTTCSPALPRTTSENCLPSPCHHEARGLHRGICSLSLTGCSRLSGLSSPPTDAVFNSPSSAFSSTPNARSRCWSMPGRHLPETIRHLPRLPGRPLPLAAFGFLVRLISVLVASKLSTLAPALASGMIAAALASRSLGRFAFLAAIVASLRCQAGAGGMRAFVSLFRHKTSLRPY